MHGGKSLAGVASPLLKNGRYSKYLPERLQERYRTAVTDPNLLVLREDISLLDARLADVLTRVDTGESGARWKQVKTACTAYAKARNTEEENACWDDLRAAISAGVADYEAWDEIHDVLMRREKLVASERKRLVDLQQMITAEQANVLMKQIADSIRTHVTDRDAVQAISADLLRLLNTQPRGVVEVR